VTVVEERPAAPTAPPPRRPNRLWAMLRNSWRQLTSMRTALVLLFLLAVAAIPGSVLPQRSVNAERVAEFYAQHPTLAPVINRLGGFEVFAAPWFAAIYLLLFTSLVGCVLPRLADHVRALRTVPPDAPKRLDRLPQHAPDEARPHDPAATAASVAAILRRRRFRTVVRERPDGSWTVAAEKGYAKEGGNLLFHFALLAVLVGVGFGSWYGWHGNRLLVQGDDTAFCFALSQFDESSLGPRVSPDSLPKPCLELTGFSAAFQPTGQPKSFRATVDVSWADGSGPSRTADFTVNDPLRLRGANVHLLGHGYAPVLRYTDRYGDVQTNVFPFLPTDAMLTSEGVATFPDANVNPKTEVHDNTAQVAFEGVYLPTVDPDGSPTSIFPAERAPVLYLSAYRGDLGLNSGIPSSVYALNRAQITRGQLKQVSGARPQRLEPGQSWTLDDGTKLEFVGTRPFVTLAVRYDPTQRLVLVGAVLGLIGLMLSLSGRRRRFWFRVTPADPDLTGPGTGSGGSVVQAGGLPRTDYPGFADEFAALVAATRGTAGLDGAADGDKRPERTA
jgi:cytochrome c biogenesis protein